MTIPALVLNDYIGGLHYATKVFKGEKPIETRWGRMFKYRGDLVICCGNSSVTENAGYALCVVNLYDARPMKNNQQEIEAACIEWHEKRFSHLLKDWRYFSRRFKFARQATKKNFQGIFEIEIPADVILIPQPQIIPYKEAA